MFLYMKHIVGKTKTISGNEKASVFKYAKFAYHQNANEDFICKFLIPSQIHQQTAVLFITICLIFRELCGYFGLLISKLHCVTQDCH